MAYLVIFGAGFALLAGGMAVAFQSGVSWAPTAWGAVVIVAATFSAMLFKRLRARVTRSTAKDSVEAVRDVSVRAAVFLDALVAVVFAMVISIVAPGVPGSLVVLGLLAVLLADYWIRFLVAVRQ